MFGVVLQLIAENKSKITQRYLLGRPCSPPLLIPICISFM